jgi:murein DD-endopeptidase MepM/ murein hydrolase activator NlpD
MPAVVALLTALLCVWPLVPRPEVVATFDPPSTPWGSGHRGVDLLGRPGETVRAAAAGSIVFAARLAGRGVVVVDHGSVRTTYEPVTATVHVGEAVTEGQPIGRLEAAPSHCFPRSCLHWGMLRGQAYLDPLTMVGAGPVRLLPWDQSPSAPSGTWAFRPVGGPGGRPGGGARW